MAVALNETEVCISPIDSPGDLFGVCDCYVQVNARIGPPKGLDTLWQPIVCNGLAGCHGQRATLEASQIIQDLRCGFGAHHDFACLVQDGVAGC